MDLFFNFQTNLFLLKVALPQCLQGLQTRVANSNADQKSTASPWQFPPNSQRALHAAKSMKHSQTLSNCLHDWFLGAGLQSAWEVVILCSPIVQIFLSFQQRQQNYLVLQGRWHYSDSQEDF